MRLVVDIMHTQIRYEDSENYLRPEIHKVMHSELGVKADGYQFSPAYKAGYWDGIIDFFDKENDTFPTGLLPHVETILGNLQSTLSKSGYIFQFEIIDDRPDEFMSVEDMDKEIVLNGDNNDKITLRDYQYESVEQVIKNRIGIVNVSTGGGKTEIASGLIQQITPYLESGERIAFFTNSSSIFSQSIDRIEKRLGIKVGAFGAGKKDIQQVTFVMIPTIVSAISADPEAKLKLTAKERMYKKIAKDIAPKFERGFNQRSLLEGYLNNFQVKTKADLQLKHELEEIFYSCGTNKQVIMKMKGYQAEYQKIVEKKNGKVLKKYNEAMEFLDSISVMIVDEAHHTSSDTWYKVLTSCNNAQYRMALTGSIDRTNHVLWQRLQAIFGEITTKVSNNTLIELGHSAKPKITIFPIIAPVDIQTTTYMDAYQKGIVDNEYRNSLIAKLTKKMYDKGNGILIIINRIEHGEAISNLLKEEGVAHYFINGQLENDLRDEKIQDMRDGALKVMISSTIIDEGVDISGIDTLILGAGGKSLRQTLQRVGRGLRKKKTGENKVEVFDFYDLTNKHLKKHSEQRRKIYEDEQFEIVDIPIPK
ncbi:DNA helicase [Enterococcus phage vB_EfaM_Ef2.3]|uniref:DNA helicase n=1 Tax=Enterococcus phage vB_EfaM_Ef2.3 TaxID=2546634 RepID=A0A4D6DUW3_9CAUD|nr:putative DNA helicase [Enterococcus phage vB_EfaH_EF1TV]QBZ70133.1 DNA helicase [Enterococcus phage vB_EfaM_Ef2.3]WDQ27677.1 DNA helicase [Enterococcus phage 53]